MSNDTLTLLFDKIQGAKFSCLYFMFMFKLREQRNVALY